MEYAVIALGIVLVFGHPNLFGSQIVYPNEYNASAYVNYIEKQVNVPHTIHKKSNDGGVFYHEFRGSIS